MSEEVKTYFRMEEDGEGNISLDVKGTGGTLGQMLASAIDDDPEIKKLFEFALMLVAMKDSGGFEPETEGEGFMNPPTAEA
jgi:hypothetical protein